MLPTKIVKENRKISIFELKGGDKDTLKILISSYIFFYYKYPDTFLHTDKAIYADKYLVDLTDYKPVNFYANFTDYLASFEIFSDEFLDKYGQLIEVCDVHQQYRLSLCYLVLTKHLFGVYESPHLTQFLELLFLNIHPNPEFRVKNAFCFFVS